MKTSLALLCAVAATGFCAAAHADELTAAKKADIVKLMSLNGTDRIVEPFSAIVTQGYMQAVGNCPSCSPKLPEIVRQETAAVLRENITGAKGLYERQAPLYHQRFSHAEIKQLVAFYTSPVGRKWVTESNTLTREGIAASQQWSRELSPQIKQRIDAALTKAGIKPPVLGAAPGSPPPSVLQAPTPAPAK